MSGEDYLQPSETSLSLTTNSNTSCVTLTIIDDSLYEQNYKQIYVVYSLNSSLSILDPNTTVILPTNETYIYINDDDCKSLAWQSALALILLISSSFQI